MVAPAPNTKMTRKDWAVAFAAGLGLGVPLCWGFVSFCYWLSAVVG